MNFKSYGTRKSTPSRMARKHVRREVFIFNKKLSKTRRKLARLARKETRVSYE
jgi:hypothetical protein